MRNYPYIFIVFLLFAAGCKESSKQNALKDITTGELIASQQMDQPNKNIVGLDIYTFQINTTNLPQIQHLMNQIKTLPINYTDENILASNGLICCAGNKADWDKINKLILKSKPQATKSVTLYAVENIGDDVAAARLIEPASILYYSAANKMAGIGLEGGETGFRIRTNSVIGLRQVCQVNFVPFYKNAPQKNKLKKDQAGREFVFDSAAITIPKLAVGQFIFIAPAAAKTGPGATKTLGDIMCYPQPKPKTVNVYLIICSFMKNS